MPVYCSFELNGKLFSDLECGGVGRFPAFSGDSATRNDPRFVSRVDEGPLPRGRYYIFDRQSGGRLGWLYNKASRVFGVDQERWFSFYRDDEVIDDWTFVRHIRRGNFRLHPIGPGALSKGCVVLQYQVQFDWLSAALKCTLPMVLADGSRAYGVLQVR
ncbi:hypothetical protein DK254_28600 [Pseudomonas sp. RW407]|uniref:DUF2778 domain-containing protein n=1 Tax=Pseudomonas sp. RW407 TaxID=2202894 RepID=UPI000D6F0226|nr:DUF2778 domain-containing protein [Pseudomonas sp. RW407]PWU26526.1 hypothetical protein DK254_28600 [Pseudomonas sp. RW407]